jgi:hypothetical protein
MGQQYAVVCGATGAEGEIAVQGAGSEAVYCADGSQAWLDPVVVPSGSDSAIPGGEAVGMQIGAAMLLVMAGAWAIRAIRRFIDSEGCD